MSIVIHENLAFYPSLIFDSALAPFPLRVSPFSDALGSDYSAHVDISIHVPILPYSTPLFFGFRCPRFGL